MLTALKLCQKRLVIVVENPKPWGTVLLRSCNFIVEPAFEKFDVTMKGDDDVRSRRARDEIRQCLSEPIIAATSHRCVLAMLMFEHVNSYG